MTLIFRQLFDPQSSTYTYLLACGRTRQAILIDPVFEQARRDSALIAELGLALAYTVETHGLYISHMAKARVADNSAYDVSGATVDDHAVWFLWPNMALMRYPGRGNFMVWRFIPDGPERTREEFDFYFETATLTPSEEEAIRYIDHVLQKEDIDIVESVQRGMESPGFRRGPYLIDPAHSGLDRKSTV